MAIEQIKMPQLGESVTEGTISKWLVSVGDQVNKYEPLAEVMTDKVNAEIPSSFTGIIKELVAAEGDTLEVGAVLCTVEVEDGPLIVTEDTNSTQDQNIIKSEEVIESSKKWRYSPAVLKLSEEHNIDLSEVKGTGTGGRITRKDLLAFISSESKIKDRVQSIYKETAGLVDLQNQQLKTTKEIKKVAGDIEIPASAIRKTIAANMLKSKHEIPHAWTMVEVDVTSLVDYRNGIKDQFKNKEGFNLTFFAFFVKAVAQALKEFPQLNSTWAGDTIIQKKDVNICIAVATDDALYVPVIRHADEKTIKGIAKDIKDLAVKTRSGSLVPEDMQGGTFTINNTGSFGSIQSMGIINYPQAAILQVESIVKRPVIINGMIAVRDMVNLCLSLDHRVLDGVICGRFLQRVKSILENTSKENTPIY